MKTVYIDGNYMCHLETAPGREQVSTEAFDGIPDQAIQYYRMIPYGEEWIHPGSGDPVCGEFIQAVNTTAINQIVQEAHMNDMLTALQILGVNP